VLPADVPKLFAPLAGSADGARYLPFVGGVADVLYISKTHQVEAHRTVGRLVEPIEGPDPVAWAEGHAAELDLRWLDGGGVEGVPRAALPGVALTAEALEGWGEDFLRWIRTDAPLALWRCPEAKLTSEPDEGERDFRVRCAMALRETRDRKREALRAKFEKRMAALHARMQRATSAVERETQQAQQRRMDAAISVGTALLGSFLGRRGPSATRVGSAMRSVTRVRKEAGDVRRAEGSVEQLRADLERLGSELERELAALPLTSPEQLALEPLPIRARSTNMRLRYLGLVWVPYRAAADGRLRPAGSVAGP
jgi:predicted component of type VI protein secretion system